MESNYAETCKEVLEVLSKVPKKQLELIPYDILNKLKIDSEKSNKKVQIKFDKYGNPILSDEAKSMLLLIYQKYFLDDRVRELLITRLVQNDNFSN